jgi:hypothetical protein
VKLELAIDRLGETEERPVHNGLLKTERAPARIDELTVRAVELAADLSGEQANLARSDKPRAADHCLVDSGSFCADRGAARVTELPAELEQAADACPIQQNLASSFEAIVADHVLIDGEAVRAQGSTARVVEAASAEEAADVRTK